MYKLAILSKRQFLQFRTIFLIGSGILDSASMSDGKRPRQQPRRSDRDAAASLSAIMMSL
jgi:hypothetical protein